MRLLFIKVVLVSLFLIPYFSSNYAKSEALTEHEFSQFCKNHPGNDSIPEPSVAIAMENYNKYAMCKLACN